jgi:hypothetical protein
MKAFHPFAHNLAPNHSVATAGRKSLSAEQLACNLSATLPHRSTTDLPEPEKMSLWFRQACRQGPTRSGWTCGMPRALEESEGNGQSHRVQRKKKEAAIRGIRLTLDEFEKTRRGSEYYIHQSRGGSSYQFMIPAFLLLLLPVASTFSTTSSLGRHDSIYTPFAAHACCNQNRWACVACIAKQACVASKSHTLAVLDETYLIIYSSHGWMQGIQAH